MKYIVALCVAIIAGSLLRSTSIDLFLAGWLSCMSYYITIEIYEKKRNR